MLRKLSGYQKKLKKSFCLYMMFAVLFSLMPQLGVSAAGGDPAVVNKSSEPHVVGNKLINAEGKEVRLIGVNCPGMVDVADGSGHMEDSFKEAFDNWRSNTIRIALSQDLWFGKGSSQGGDHAGYRALLDKLVNMASERGKYIVLDLAHSDMGTWSSTSAQHMMPDDNTTAFWQSAAAIYANNPTVLFDLYNEPHDVSWEVWRNGGTITEGDKTYHTPGMQGLVDTVRSTGAKNIVIAGGNGWAFDLTGVKNGYALTDTTGNGIMYAAHFYSWHTDPNKDAMWDTGWDANISVIKDDYPIFIGEAGFYDPAWYRTIAGNENWNPEPPETWIPKFFNFLDSNEYNFCVFAFDVDAAPAMLDNWDYSLTPQWGEYAKPKIQSYDRTYVPTPTPSPTPSGTTGEPRPEGVDVAIRINCGGDALTINGNKWLSQSEAEANGFKVVRGGAWGTGTTSFSPAVDADTNTMLNSLVYKSEGSVNLTQSLYNGKYEVYLWCVENYFTNIRGFNLKLEGTQVATGLGRMPLNEWKKYGPYTVAVTDGVLNIDMVRLAGDPLVNGIEIYSVDEPAPTPSPVPAKWTRVDNTHAGVTYVGKWNTLNDPKCYGKSIKYSNTDGSYIQYKFKGTGARWLTTLGKNHGKADVYVDGVLKMSGLDTYSKSGVFQKKAYEITGLKNGSHVLKIVVTNKKNPGATDYRQDADAFEYCP